MGNNPSRASSKNKPKNTLKYTKSPKVKRQNHRQTVPNTSKNAEQKSSTDNTHRDTATHSSSHTPPANTSHFEEMFSSHMPAGIIGRQKGWNFVFPFSSLMCEWTDGMWPYEGSFEKEKLQMAEMNVDSNVGNPSWDFGYMRKCLHVWLTVARQRCGVNVSDKEDDRCSDELKDTIDEMAGCVGVRHMPMLETALQTRALEMTKIKQRHGDNLNACAKAMMYNWAKRQSKIPSHGELTNVLKHVGLVPPAREEDRQVLSNYPKLSKTNPLPHTNSAKQATTQQTTEDTDFLLCTAAALEEEGRHAAQGTIRQDTDRQTVADRGRREREEESARQERENREIAEPRSRQSARQGREDREIAELRSRESARQEREDREIAELSFRESARQERESREASLLITWPETLFLGPLRGEIGSKSSWRGSPGDEL